MAPPSESEMFGTWLVHNNHGTMTTLDTIAISCTMVGVYMSEVRYCTMPQSITTQIPQSSLPILPWKRTPLIAPFIHLISVYV